MNRPVRIGCSGWQYDSWRGGADNHDAGEGEWSQRLAAAARAWWEWMPVREAPLVVDFRGVTRGITAKHLVRL